MSDNEIDIFKNDIENKKERSKSIENSFAYLWSINKDERVREIIINQFLRAVGEKL